MKFLRKLSKWALVMGILVVSTLLFAIWWFTRKSGKLESEQIPGGGATQALAEDSSETNAKSLAEKIGHWIYVDNSVYDISTGQLLAKNWLAEGRPQHLFWDGAGKQIISQTGTQFVRYGLNGKVLGRFGGQNMQFVAGGKIAVFLRNKDVWKADPDWSNFKFTNERQVTSIGQFSEGQFVENVFIATEKTLVVRNLGQMVRVNLENGEVHPTPGGNLTKLSKLRSPDSRFIAGGTRGQFYCADIDANDAKMVDIGRETVVDFTWLDNDHGVALVSGRSVMLYDRASNALSPVATLPSNCVGVSTASPGNRFVLCAGRANNVVLVDLEKKTTAALVGGMGMEWVSEDTIAFSRDVLDSTLRGTWFQKAGEAERRVDPDPYIVNRQMTGIAALRNSNGVLMVTTKGLATMRGDGSDYKIVVPLTAIPAQVCEIGEWKGPQEERDASN